jgi:hypothetical protein
MVLALPKVSGNVWVGISSCAFMVKAHEFKWAFGFGLDQNTGPDAAEQEIFIAFSGQVLVTACHHRPQLLVTNLCQ